MTRVRADARTWGKNLLLLGIGMFALAALWWKAHGYGAEVVSGLIAWVDALGWIGWLVFLLALIATCMSGVLPASVLAVAAGGIYGLALGFFLCAIAIMAAACLAFLLSRHVLRERFQALASQHALIAQLDGEIAASGWKLVFLLRMSPLAPFGLVSYAFGLSRVSLGAYIVGTLASLPALLALVYTGAVAGEAISTLGGIHSARSWAEWLILVGGFIATLASAFYLSLLARRALNKANKQVEST